MQMWILDGKRDWSIIKKWKYEHTLEIIPVKEQKTHRGEALKKPKKRKCLFYIQSLEYLKIMKEGA